MKILPVALSCSMWTDWQINRTDRWPWQS